MPAPQAVVGQIPILFAATYETCQIALTWTLFLLAYAVTFRPRGGLPAVLHPADGAWAAAPVTGQIHDMVDLAAA
ncbi:MAG TPA: hypothetical protein VFB88_21805 [Xanthobacteraceae bacterium]|nr:hypothetical protein [Xanthobacteraceae bacterium]